MCLRLDQSRLDFSGRRIVEENTIFSPMNRYIFNADVLSATSASIQYIAKASIHHQWQASSLVSSTVVRMTNDRSRTLSVVSHSERLVEETVL